MKQADKARSLKRLVSLRTADLSGKVFLFSERMRIFCDGGFPIFRWIPTFRRIGYDKDWGLFGFTVYWLGRETWFSFGKDIHGLYRETYAARRKQANDEAERTAIAETSRQPGI